MTTAPMQSERTRQMLRLAQKGDETARSDLIEQNLPLVRSLAYRYKDRGADLEDLIQIGSLGLYKAILRFDLAREVQFSTYAVPLILGEIRRHFRDDGMLRISRTLKDLSRRIFIEMEHRSSCGLGCGLEELANALHVSLQEIILALESRHDIYSLDMPLNQENTVTLAESIAADVDEQQNTLLRLTVDQLEEREKNVIYLRYYQGVTQSACAASLGLSQAQISRIENRALQHLREIL